MNLSYVLALIGRRGREVIDDLYGEPGGTRRRGARAASSRVPPSPAGSSISASRSSSSPSTSAVSSSSRRGPRRRIDIEVGVGDTLLNGGVVAPRARRLGLARGDREGVPPRDRADDGAGPEVRAAPARRRRDQGALPGHQRPDDRRAGARPDRGSAAPDRRSHARSRPARRRSRLHPRHLSGADLGRPARSRDRRDPDVRRRLPPGRAAPAPALPRPRDARWRPSGALRSRTGCAASTPPSSRASRRPTAPTRASPIPQGLGLSRVA